LTKVNHGIRVSILSSRCVKGGTHGGDGDPDCWSGDKVIKFNSSRLVLHYLHYVLCIVFLIDSIQILSTSQGGRLFTLRHCRAWWRAWKRTGGKARCGYLKVFNLLITASFFETQYRPMDLLDGGFGCNVFHHCSPCLDQGDHPNWQIYYLYKSRLMGVTSASQHRCDEWPEGYRIKMSLLSALLMFGPRSRVKM
jgi:hypothetical protein